MKEIIVLGLGPGSIDYLSYKAWQILKSSKTITLRTEKHPVVEELREQGVEFTTFDYLYEEKSSFTEVYHEIVEKLITKALESSSFEPLIYGVPGHPLVAEDSVKLLLHEGKVNNITITVIPGMSFLDSLYPVINIDPIEGFLMLDALALKREDLNEKHHTIFTQVYNRFIASDLKLTLLDVYSPNHPVMLVKAAGLTTERVEEVPLCELDHIDWFDHLTSVYVKPQIIQSKAKAAEHPSDKLVAVMDKLLSPQGCPWDQKQDHFSLKPYLLEEAYEVIEAIDSKNMYKLKEELGDLLLQVVFHAALAQKRGDFTYNEVIEGITQKMVRRHPHVFSDIKVKNAEEVLENWEQIKAVEKGKIAHADKKKTMDKLNKSLSALLLAEEVQKKAQKVGFDWPHVKGALDKVEEEIKEVEAAFNNEGDIEEEIGDLLFSVVNIARFVKVSPEIALYGTINKFIRRFNYIEETLQTNGKRWEEMGINDLDRIWEKAKKNGL